MSIKLRLKHSSVASKAPLPADLVEGELALNTNSTSPAAYLKDSTGAIVKLAGAGSVSTPDATTTVKGITQLADAAALAAGTTGRVVDAAQLKTAQAAQAGSTTAPAAPTAGQVWINNSVTPAVTNVWNGTAWVPQVGATISSATAPAAPATGQVWVNTSVTPNVTSIWDGTAWVAAKPDGAAVAAIANDAKYATKAELATENLWDKTGTTLSPATAGDLVAVAALPTATETAAGIVELATAAETTTGTDATRAVHPAGLTAALTFTQAGTGAKPRSYDSKLKDTVSVKDFGAVGDGVADDTAAFNAALSASASINVIYVPPGNIYRITSTINITGNKSIIGPDAGSQNFQPAFIHHDPTSTGPLFQVRTPNNGVCIKNLTITGGNGSFCIESSNEYVRYEYLKMQSYNGSGIRLLSSEAGSSSSRLINCEWIGPATPTSFTGFEIVVNGGDVHLKGCTAIHGAIGINIAQGQTVIIEGCSVNKQSRYAKHSSAAQFDTAGIKLSGTAYKQAVSIKNSYIEGCDNGIYVESCESLSIEDNLLYDSGSAGVVGAWTAYGNSSIYLKDTNAKNVTIKNNSITALANGDAGHTFYALRINDASNVVLLNNHITTTGSYNAQLYVTTPVNAYVLANTQAQSGSNPQASYNPNNALLDLNPKLPAWVSPTLQNSWANVGFAAYTKDHMNCVMLRGVIGSGTIGTTAFTLPAGYWPDAQESFAVNSNGAFGIVTIYTDGRVEPVAGNNAYVYLSGIRFHAG